ncbi:MAG: hypothetical protein INR73_11360 [Williamsia sp.]|nr:hypothetical protein [Williamsia sp.]
MKLYQFMKQSIFVMAVLTLTTSCTKPQDNKPGSDPGDPTGTGSSGGYKVTVTTIAGKLQDQGSAEDGNGSHARFWNPTKMVYDNRNHLLYVADGTVVRSIDEQNNVATYMPLGVISRWSEILDMDLAPGAGGSLYLVTAENDLIKIEPGGNGVKKTVLAERTYGGNATGSLNSSDHFDGANGIATGKSGEIYFFNTFWATMHQIVLNPASSTTGTVKQFVGKALASRSGESWPFADGQGETATFGSGVYDIASDAQGTIYVADAKNYELRMVTPAGMVSSLMLRKVPNYGEEVDGPVSTKARANGVLQVSCSQDGSLIFFNTYGKGGWQNSPALRVVKDKKEVFTLVGTSNAYGDGTEKTAAFGTIGGLASTPDGKTVYVSEPAMKVIRKVVLQ